MLPEEPNVENPTENERISTVHSIENDDPLTGTH